jgi:DNA-binding transcriptional MerR regulator
MDVEIPAKLYFKIGEVAELTGVKPHVLRYWESEFSPFRPAKSRSKQRLYRRKDIELVLRLKDLLYNQGYTLAGAKKKLREEGGSQLTLPLAATPERRLLEELRKDLRRLRKTLSACQNTPA